jgi:hypothetical protein
MLFSSHAAPPAGTNWRWQLTFGRKPSPPPALRVTRSAHHYHQEGGIAITLARNASLASVPMADGLVSRVTNAMPGILTGTIRRSRVPLAKRRRFCRRCLYGDQLRSKLALSKFTLPIKYQWTSRPQDEFRSLAAASILVLLIMLLSLNASAILLRNRFSRRF